jgi:putative PIN family toxin of toxin-antitoxin system
MRIVADANVLVSAALARSPQSPSVLILEAVLDDRVELVVSPALLAELAEVLARPRIRRYVTADEAEEFVSYLSAHALFVADALDPPQVCRDPDDDYLVALARVTNADSLVTGDDDLLAIDPGRVVVNVVTPREFADRLG